jgi:hypothetical protein
MQQSLLWVITCYSGSIYERWLCKVSRPRILAHQVQFSVECFGYTEKMTYDLLITMQHNCPCVKTENILTRTDDLSRTTNTRM